MELLESRSQVPSGSSQLKLGCWSTRSEALEVIEPNQMPNRIEKLVSRAEKMLLVSGYFRPWGRLATLIKDAGAAGKQVDLVVRGGDQLREHMRTSGDYWKSGVKFHYLKGLHAKVYVSDSEAILTSLNLTESSANNSWEAGIAVQRETSPAEYRELAELASGLKELAEAEKKRVLSERRYKKGKEGANKTKSSENAAKREKKTEASDDEEDVGFCINCLEKIPFDYSRPLCRECYLRWDGSRRHIHGECHSCGGPDAQSVDDPVCPECQAEMDSDEFAAYRKATEVY
jgi:PLD-like domain